MVTASQLQILQSPITGLISSVSSSVSVKLDDSNYLQWHFQMQLLLEGYGIMGFVDGSTCCPSQFSSISSSDSEASSMGVGSRIESDDYKAWKMHDYALMLLLTATLSSSAISYVIGSTSSREMWVRLQNHFFLPSTKTSIIKLQTCLYNMTKGSDSISQFLRRIKEARDGLSVLGVTLADEDFVLIALNGLPATYNTFKCVIRGREGVISLENFGQQLLAEEAIVNCASVTKFGDCQTQGVYAVCQVVLDLRTSWCRCSLCPFANFLVPMQLVPICELPCADAACSLCPFYLAVASKWSAEGE